MRGLVLTRVGAGSAPEAPLTARADWFAALADVFALRFENVAPERLNALWDRVYAGHVAWEDAGRP